MFPGFLQQTLPEYQGPSFTQDQKYPSLIIDHFKQRRGNSWPSLESYKPTLTQILALEKDTRDQGMIPLQHMHRMGRIMADAVYDVEIQSPVALTKIFEKVSHDPSDAWNRSSKKVARDAYVSKQLPKHQGFKWEATGLLIDFEKPFLGACSDGEVNCTCCGKGLVMVECPFAHRYSTINEAIEDPNFCLDSSRSLKKGHSCYVEAQLQMHIHKVKYCDLFVYTVRENHCCRVEYSQVVCEDLVRRLEEFYEDQIVPAIRGSVIRKQLAMANAMPHINLF